MTGGGGGVIFRHEMIERKVPFLGKFYCFNLSHFLVCLKEISLPKNTFLVVESLPSPVSEEIEGPLGLLIDSETTRITSNSLSQTVKIILIVSYGLYRLY